MPAFATAINCMDGRTQLPVIRFLQERLNVDYVDTITEPGPVRALADDPESPVVQSILVRLDISVTKHRSRGIAVVAHHDCAGNPLDKTTQIDQLRRSVAFLRRRHPHLLVLGLWVDESWQVHEI